MIEVKLVEKNFRNKKKVSTLTSLPEDVIFSYETKDDDDDNEQKVY